MRPADFLGQARVLVVTGKGGAGKTTVSGSLANLAARHGLYASVVQAGPATMHHDADGLQAGAAGPGLGVPKDGLREKGTGTAGHLPGLFGAEVVIGYEPVQLALAGAGGRVEARALAPDTALVEYLDLHGMRRLSRRLVASGALEVVATAVPGMPDMLVLGKVKQMERAASNRPQDGPDVIVLDAPAAGHAVRFLGSPRGVLEAAASGPVRSQAQDVVDMVSDPRRCQVVLVTTPEETPVSETLETARLLVERAGAHIGMVVVNARLPVLALPPETTVEAVAMLAKAVGVELTEPELSALADAGRLRAQRQESQATQVERLASELDVARLEVPFCFSSSLGPEQLDALTDALERSVEALPRPAR